MFGSGMNLITTVIGFGMSATFILFVCTRLICGRMRAADSREAFEVDSSTDIEQPEQRSGGLEPIVVASLPTMKFNHEAFESVEDAQCSICLGEYQEKEILRIIPKCGHIFHVSCVDLWLHKQSTCPVCRLPLQDSFEKIQMRSPRSGMPIDSPEIMGDHSQQWLLPGPDRSVHNGNNLAQMESIPGNSAPSVSRGRNQEIIE
ncbi:hypothetical protein IFM89_035087 [Coptis chinensis]|uniref:RING-type domain-containing protein n=1 Tax=Coptis chinensis TaxID=261450 RepID=A0A835IFW8_9MAGN|nr:hypothetical protein IFM89_035087 [Coptis chinensis]